MYIGNVNEKIEVSTTYKKTFTFFSPYGETHIHKFTDENGNVFVWKTSKMVEYTKNGRCELVPEGSVVKISGTIKEHKEYNSEQQTVLLRCKIDVIKTSTEKKEAEKRKEQFANLQTGDMVLTMPYRNYKKHYADCETVAGSFNANNGFAEISVIIKNGRMVESGVRGKRFSTYVLQNKETEIKMCFYAVCEENAFKQAQKEKGFNPSEWECIRIFNGK